MSQEARWRDRLAKQARVDTVPPDWVQLDEADELFGDMTLSTPGPAELLAWLWPEKVLRRYLVKQRIVERWFAPGWLVMAYNITPGVMTDQGLMAFDPASIRAYGSHHIISKGTRPDPGQPTLDETRWLALRMHRDDTFRGKALTIYRLGGLDKLKALVPSKRPRARRERCS